MACYGRKSKFADVATRPINSLKVTPLLYNATTSSSTLTPTSKITSHPEIVYSPSPLTSGFALMVLSQPVPFFSIASVSFSTQTSLASPCGLEVQHRSLSTASHHT